MNSSIDAIIITLISGLFTFFGALVVLFIRGSYKNILPISLAFAAGVMISVSVIDLIPESLNLFLEKMILIPSLLNVLMFILLGAFLARALEKYLPDHFDHKENNQKIYRIGIITMLAIIMHNLPEGIATYMATSTNTSLGITLAISIALHNFPEGISIAIPIYYGSGSKMKALLLSLLAGLAEVLGAILAAVILAPYINNFIMGCLLSLIAGIMLAIGGAELLPAALKINNKRYTCVAFSIGVILMVVNHLIH